MGLSGVYECMNNYEYYINVLSYLLDLSAKQLKQHAREVCISGAWKPQERASKAKCLIGTIVHAVQQDSHNKQTHMHTHTNHPSLAQRESHHHSATCCICTLTVPMEVHI